MQANIELSNLHSAIAAELKGFSIPEELSNDYIPQMIDESIKVFYLLRLINIEWRDHYKLPVNIVKSINSRIVEFVKSSGFSADEVKKQTEKYFGKGVDPQWLTERPELCAALIGLATLGKNNSKDNSTEKPLHYYVDLGEGLKVSRSSGTVINNTATTGKITSSSNKSDLTPQYNQSAFFSSAIQESIASANQQYTSADVPKEHDHFFKVIMYGDRNVGKTHLVLRWANEEYQSYNHSSIVGVDYRIKAMNIDKKIIKLQVWDLHQNDRFRTIASGYERGVQAAIFVIDGTDKESFANLGNLLKEFETNAPSTASRILVVSKMDLNDKWILKDDELAAYAKKHQMIGPIKYSAKTGTNVDIVFEITAKAILERFAPQSNPSSQNHNNNNNNNKQSDEDSNKCSIM